MTESFKTMKNEDPFEFRMHINPIAGHTQDELVKLIVDKAKFMSARRVYRDRDIYFQDQGTPIFVFANDFGVPVEVTIKEFDSKTGRVIETNWGVTATFDERREKVTQLHRRMSDYELDGTSLKFSTEVDVEFGSVLFVTIEAFTRLDDF